MSPMAFYESQPVFMSPMAFYESQLFFSIFIFINFFLLWVREIGTFNGMELFSKNVVSDLQIPSVSTHIAFASIMLVAFLIKFSTFSSTKLMQASLNRNKNSQYNKSWFQQTKIVTDENWSRRKAKIRRTAFDIIDLPPQLMWCGCVYCICSLELRKYFYKSKTNFWKRSVFH